MSNVVYMTIESVKEIQEELHKLKTKGRKEIAQKIADARSHGDLSENAEYDAAKEEQGHLESKIANLENILARVQVIKAEDMPNDKVYILSKVKLKNLKTKKIFDFILVSPEEADFEKGKISVTSPMGKELLGKIIGDKIQIKAPVGIIEWELLDISK